MSNIYLKNLFFFLLLYQSITDTIKKYFHKCLRLGLEKQRKKSIKDTIKKYFHETSRLG